MKHLRWQCRPRFSCMVPSAEGIVLLTLWFFFVVITFLYLKKYQRILFKLNFHDLDPFHVTKNCITWGTTIGLWLHQVSRKRCAISPWLVLIVSVVTKYLCTATCLIRLCFQHSKFLWSMYCTWRKESENDMQKNSVALFREEKSCRFHRTIKWVKVSYSNLCFIQVQVSCCTKEMEKVLI